MRPASGGGSHRKAEDGYPLAWERQAATRAQVGDWQGFLQAADRLQSHICLTYAGDLERLKAHGFELEAILARVVARVTGLDEPALAAKEAGFEVLAAAGSTRHVRAALAATVERYVGILRAASTVPDTAPVLDRACGYLREHYAEKVTVEQVARAVNASSQYLCRLFRRELNLTIMDFLTEIRIKKAKDLLDHSALRVSEIATRVGYADASHFTKAFKQVEAMTPTQYRERG